MLNIEQIKSYYRNNDPVHGFDHIVRVNRIAKQLASAEKADLEIVEAAVLLHDAQDPQSTAIERNDHQLSSAALAARILTDYDWDRDRIKAVQHCITTHRFRNNNETPKTLEAKILSDADKLDAIGATGIARAISYAVIHQSPVYSKPSDTFMSTYNTESGEEHSAYHEYLFKLRKIKSRLYTPSAQTLAGKRHSILVQFFDQLAEEMEATD